MNKKRTKKMQEKTLTGIDYLLNLSQENSREFNDSGLSLLRRQYRANHPTEIAVTKCMDGRIHLPRLTNMQLGIINPWRNLGGKFDLGWPFFGLAVNEWVQYAINKGRDCLVLVTYHYSRGEKHRGCRGFNYDVSAAREYTKNLKKEFDDDFGTQAVYAVQCGVETDLDALVLHGENEQILDLSEIHDSSAEVLVPILRKLYPGMRDKIRADFLPIIQGNIAHIREIKKMRRPLADAEHKEWVLAVGRGFDLLHEINTAFIVGPFDPDLRGAIKTAATLLKDNWESGRISEKQLVLMTCAPYDDATGPERLLAARKSKFLSELSQDVIKSDKGLAGLMSHLQILVATVDMKTRLLNVLERN